MDKPQYLAFKSDLARRAEALHEELAEITRQIEALDLVWNKVVNVNNKPSEEDDDPKPILTVIERIRIAAKELGTSKFTSPDIISILSKSIDPKKINATTISAGLMRLVSLEEIELIHRGKGRRASIFKVKKLKSTNDEN